MGDVAKVAGVSVSTVSRVLSGAPHISDEVRHHVHRASKQLGYTPNLLARSLRTGRTRSVSVLLPSLGTEFYTTLLRSVQESLEPEGIDLALFPLFGRTALARYRNPESLAFQADGLIVTSLDMDQLLGDTRAAFTNPTVLLDAHDPKYHSISFDNGAAGRIAAEYALSLGAPIGIIDGPLVPLNFVSPVFHERRTGVAHALELQGVHPVATVESPVTTEGGRIAADTLAANGLPRGSVVIAATDDMAIGALRQFESRGWAIGGDVRIIGFDDSSAARDVNLTTVHQPVRDMGRAAAEVMLEVLRTQRTTIAQRVFAPRLVRRSSA